MESARCRYSKSTDTGDRYMMRFVIIITTLLTGRVLAQTPSSPWQDEFTPVSPISVLTDPDCPVSSAEAWRNVNAVLTSQGISLTHPPFRINVELSCYQLDTLNQPSYSLTVQFQARDGEVKPFRRMGVTPGSETGDGSYLQESLSSGLEHMLLSYLKETAE
jgi:hypothetical protein